LRRLGLLCLTDLRRANPEWSLDDLVRHLDLPDTRLIQELAQQAGFVRPDELTSRQENQILRSLLRGRVSVDAIAQENGIPPNAVKAFLKDNRFGYGAGGYGQVAWGQPFGVAARPERSKTRRISRKGQFSYRGRVYGLGTGFAGEVCWIEEAGSRLLVHCAGRPGIAVHKRA
jgi:hypothetical protein